MTGAADQMFGTPAMAAIFSADSHIRAILRFESALAIAESRAGVIPAAAADAIVAACDSAEIDIDTLYRDAALAGTVVIPLVGILSERVASEQQTYIHWGATSQDAIDTAMMLQMRDGLALIEADVRRVAAACATLAAEHRCTLMPGRTLLQQAVPISFGLKAARWLGLMVRQMGRLRDHNSELALQFGGAAGTLAALGDRGLEVAQLLADELGLALPDVPWHTERDRVASIASALGITAGCMAKVADDIVLLSQTEIGEVSEASAPGKGGSSAMPQKRNPVDCTFVRASARLAIAQVPIILSAMEQEQERAAGAWQAEWSAMPALFLNTAGCVSSLSRAVERLEVHPERMRANLEASGGLMMAESLSLALAPRVGGRDAQRLVKSACNRAASTAMTLKEVAVADEEINRRLDADEIDRALEPSNYLGSTETFIDRTLAAFAHMSHISGPES